MSGLDVIGADLSRILGEVAALASVDQAVRARAEAAASGIEQATGRTPADVRIARLGPGDYEVTVSAANLLSREFGALDGSADPLVGPAVARLAGGPRP